MVRDNAFDLSWAFGTKDFMASRRREIGMGRNKKGVRSGSGPYKGSDRARKGLSGRRRARGEKCPKK